MFKKQWARILKTIWCVMTVMVAVVVEVNSLSGPNVCMVQQKYNITKRVKYRAPMSVRTYEWCFSIPPRCSKWSTEMRDLTRLETEERIAEVAVCCQGYKMKDVSCVPMCPSGRTGHGCTEECPPNKWGPNCVNECVKCLNGFCSPLTGECDCLEGWQGESCQISMSTARPSTALIEELLTTTKSSVQTLSTTKPTKLTTLRMSPRRTTFTSSSITTSSITTTRKQASSTIKLDPVPTTTSSTLLTSSVSEIYNNKTLSTPTVWVGLRKNVAEDFTQTTEISFIYNRTETPAPEGTSTRFVTEHVTPTTLKISTPTKANSISPKPLPTSTSSSSTETTTALSLEKGKTKVETTTARRLEATTKHQILTTTKFKPKEIWIKPTQKGDMFSELKSKTSNESSNSRHKNEIAVVNTTPKTIIVSIIPTSISHASFKKIALTTASYIAQKNNVAIKNYKKLDQEFISSTESSTSTAMPFTIKISPSIIKNFGVANTKNKFLQPNYTKSSVNSTKKYIFKTTDAPETSTLSMIRTISNITMATGRTTNSMLSTLYEISNKKNLNSSNFVTTKSLTNNKTNQHILYEITTKSTSTMRMLSENNKKAFNKTQHALLHGYATKKYDTLKTDAGVKSTKIPFSKFNTTKKNMTKSLNFNVITTEEPNEETFHILTEPEHITAVMTDKEREHSSVDLISVISIAGGVMMAVITVAVIIVMIERCKRPNSENAMKMNEFGMQAMMDSDDVPPPYVRSIFHTPLPDPPTSEKCHYQPISTLDRNLKQFMRPVVVQTISPIMLENFRGILECHYDHLPKRDYEFETTPLRSSVSPSMNDDDERRRLHRPLSVAETIEALKCEAQFDVLDNSTSEPLYAEIPCWRPPSEHAVEVVNLNGEAVTEL